MSTNKSAHLNLHLWEPEDDFLRREFNENFTALDGAVKTVQAAAEKAQSAAEEAAKAPYAVGRYSGKGSTEQSISLGFRPSMLLIYAMLSGNDPYNVAGTITVTDGSFMTEFVELTDTGFTLKPYISGSSSKYPRVNDTGLYVYIAFR